MNRKVTILDIAKSANVSKSTVSRVLNETTPVNDEKREAVLAAMKRLNYRPSLVARSLAGGHSMTIGIVTHNIGSPFYDSVTQGIVHGLAGTDYSPLFADGQWNPKTEASVIATLVDRNVDGLIMVGGTLPPEKMEAQRSDKPLVLVARKIDDWPHTCIAIDNRLAAQEAVQYLIESGHRQIAHIAGIKRHRDAQDRKSGYQEALKNAGIPIDPELIVQGNFSSQSGVLAAEALLMKGVTFTALFASNDEMALGARLAFYRRGIRVPEDVSVIGFDDQPSSAYMTPPLTTVAQPAEAMGKSAAQAMLAQILKQNFQPSELKPKLVIRESVKQLR